MNNSVMIDILAETRKLFDNKSEIDQIFGGIYYKDINPLRKYAVKSNINQTNMYGFTPLMQSCYYNFEKGIVLLLKRGANPNLKSYLGKTALHIAIESNIANRIINLLIYIGTDLDIQDNQGKTPLITAIKYGNIEIASSLILAGSNLDLCDNSNYSALKTACYYGHIDIIKSLLDAGAKITALEQNLKTSITVNKITREKIVEMLSVACYLQTHNVIVSTNIKNTNDCCVCYAPIAEKYVLIPCGHYSTCKNCVEKVNRCPMCMRQIKSNMRIFD